MFSKKIIINLPKKDSTIYLEPLSDLHIGHSGFDKKLYEKRIKEISSDPLRFTFFGGDMLDAVNVYDKRFNPDMSTEHDIDNQRQMWQDLSQDLFNKHKKSKNSKVWGLFHGNHEYNIKAITRAYIENTMTKPNGIDFMGSRGVIGLEMRYKNKILDQKSIFFTHGSGGGENVETALIKIKTNNFYDLYGMGHLHQKRYMEQIVMDYDWDSGKTMERDIVMFNTGTFCKTLIDGVDGYMDRKNSTTPSQTGTVTISFNAYKGTMNGHV